MKAKKFLKLIQAHCKEENCRIGKCPALMDKGKYKDCCIFSVDSNPEDWDIKAIVKVVKKLKGGKHGR